MSGQRCGFRSHALHQVAVADDGIDVVVHDLVPWLVVPCGQEACRQRHADARGKALPERPGGRLDAGRTPVFRVSRGHALPLAEALEFIQRQGIPGQVQQAVQQHRAVPGREDKAVAIEPLRVTRAVVHELRPQYICGVGHAHRHAGVSRLGLLYAVGSQEANGVNA